MLDAFIIEQLKEIEQKRRERHRPVQVPLDVGIDCPPPPSEEKKEDTENTGVVIIDYNS